MQQIRKQRRRPTQRKQRWLVATLAPAALIGVAATGYIALSSDQVVAAGIGCYDAPDRGANVTVVDTTGEDPREVCAELWAEGVVSEGDSEAPQLVPCVNEEGAILVFPSDDATLCSRLGLQELPGDYEEQAKRFAAMRDDVWRELYRTGRQGGVAEAEICLDGATALGIVSSVLDEHGLDDWSAAVREGDYRDRTCMNEVAFEDAEKRVWIIPVERGMIPWHRDPTM